MVMTMMTTNSVKEQSTEKKDSGSSLTLKTGRGVYSVQSNMDEYETIEDFCVQLLIPLADKLEISLDDLIKELFFENNNRPK